jgi:DNA-binding winged helix-turn-helix (wHTH) protein
MALRFGQIELDLDAFEVRRDGERVHVEPQVFEVVRYLVEHRDRMVPKEELLEQVWGTRFVSESALTSRIKAARRALDDDGREQRVIRTVHGRGYRFVAPLTDDGSSAHPERAGGTRGAGSYGRGLPILEREAALRGLDDAVADAAAGRGRVVFVSGEAGIGKTSVVRAFLAAHAGLRALVGTCDDLVTPLPLGPLRDAAAGAEPALAAARSRARPPATCSERWWPSSAGRPRPPCSSSRTCTGPTRRRSTC